VLRRKLALHGSSAAEKYLSSVPENMMDEAKYNIMIHHMVSREEYAKAQSMFEKMVQNGFKPSARTMGSLINAFGTTKNVAKAEHIYYKLLPLFNIESTDFMDKALLQAYFENGKFNHAKQFYQKSKQGVYSNTIMLRILLRSGSVSEGEKLFQNMVEKKEYDTASILEMAAGYFHLDMNAKGLKVLQMLEASQIDLQNLTGVMEMLTKAGYLDEAIRIAGYLYFKLNILIHIKVFTSIIYGYITSRKFGHAERVLMLLIEEFKTEPDRFTMKTICDGYRRNGKQKQLEKLHEKLLEKYKIDIFAMDEQDPTLMSPAP
jgi:pentatricopeptide repeat protein